MACPLSDSQLALLTAEVTGSVNFRLSNEQIQYSTANPIKTSKHLPQPGRKSAIYHSLQFLLSSTMWRDSDGFDRRFRQGCSYKIEINRDICLCKIDKGFVSLPLVF